MASIEVPKESVDKVYEIIETAKTTGKVMKGTNETTKAIEKGKNQKLEFLLYKDQQIEAYRKLHLWISVT